MVDTLLGVTDQAVWATKLYLVIKDELPQTTPEGRILMVGHAAYESGWGQKAAAAKGTNNLWNITAGSAWKGRTYLHVNGDLSTKVTECARLGRPMDQMVAGQPACRIDQAWRAYATVNEAIRDYWAFLGPDQNGGRYYAARQALERGDAVDFAKKLYAAGYYTLSPDTYSAQMLAMVDSVKKRLKLT